jgi:hypothetical protein
MKNDYSYIGNLSGGVIQSGPIIEKKKTPSKKWRGSYFGGGRQLQIVKRATNFFDFVSDCFP